MGERVVLDVFHVCGDVRPLKEGLKFLDEPRLVEHKRHADQPAVRNHLVAADFGARREEAIDDVPEDGFRRSHCRVNGVLVRAGDEHGVYGVSQRAESGACGLDDTREVDVVHAAHVVEMVLERIAHGERDVQPVHRPHGGYALLGKVGRQIAEGLFDVRIARDGEGSLADGFGELAAFGLDPVHVDA